VECAVLELSEQRANKSQDVLRSFVGDSTRKTCPYVPYYPSRTTPLGQPARRTRRRRLGPVGLVIEAHMCRTTLLALLHSNNLRVDRDVDAWVQSVW
jgi:hypothetical protein